MVMPERNWSTDWYRYGWGGHEKDDAVKGKHNSIATYFRMNDPRTGRWFSMDPVTHHSQSSYTSMDDNPINNIDPYGNDVFSDIGNWVEGAWNDAGDWLHGTEASPLAPGSDGAIADVGNWISGNFGGMSVNATQNDLGGNEKIEDIKIIPEDVRTDFPPPENPDYFNKYLFAENTGSNYFGEPPANDNQAKGYYQAFNNAWNAVYSHLTHENYSPNYDFSGNIVSFDRYMVTGTPPDVNFTRGGGKTLLDDVLRLGQSSFRSFTKSNFRYNLSVFTQKIPNGYHAHHVFSKKFTNKFSGKINIHDPKFGAWWEASSHLKNAKAYNNAWTDFFRRNPNPSTNQILNQGRRLMNQYGIPEVNPKSGTLG